MTKKVELRGPSRAGWHAIEAFHHCPKEHQFRHVRKVKLSQSQLPGPLAVGVLVHFGRAWWFESGFRDDAAVMDDMRRILAEESVKYELPIAPDSERQALILLEGYIEHWSRLPKPTVLHVEHDIDGWLGEHDAERTARLDDVCLYPEGLGKLFVGELKTTSEGVEGVLRKYELHGQPLLQRLLWKKWSERQLALPAKLRSKLKTKHLLPAEGTMLDIIVKPGRTGSKPKYHRQPIYLTEWSLKWFEPSLAEYVIDAAQVKWDTKTRRNTAMCTRNISGSTINCEYKPLCMYGPEGTNGYALPGGVPLTDRKAWKGETPPWE